MREKENIKISKDNQNSKTSLRKISIDAKDNRNKQINEDPQHKR